VNDEKFAGSSGFMAFWRIPILFLGEFWSMDTKQAGITRSILGKYPEQF